MTKIRMIRYILIFIPYALIAVMPFVNKEEPRIWGLPFLWFWFFIWAVLITVLITLLYIVESKVMRVG